MADLSEFEGSRPYRVKKFLDRILPLITLLLVFYLYLELLASPEFLLYGYKAVLQYFLLGYFVFELAVLFTMYESNKRFFSNHWFDIVLTMPFVSAFKGLAGFNMVKSFKPVKVLKSTKLLRAAKISQKSGKLVKKLKKHLE